MYDTVCIQYYVSTKKDKINWTLPGLWNVYNPVEVLIHL